MAEMNAMYKKHDFDIAGFCVGAVDKEAVIDGSTIVPGDYIYALPSSGCHSNGYSLVRKILDTTNLKNEPNILQTLLEPTLIYVNAINTLKQNYLLKGIANITGGGIAENLNRVLPKTVNAVIDKSSIQVPDIFNLLQDYGEVSDEEMFRVFNMGVGMIVVSSAEIVLENAYKIGEITNGNGDVVL